MEDIEVPLLVEDMVNISEKKAVEELKDMLTCRFKNDEPVSLWGIPLTKTTTAPSQDVILFKFLKAREFSVQDSYNMLINCLSWRKDYFGQVDIVEQEFPEFKQLENLATYIHGFDRQGHPVYYNDYSTLINNQHLNHKILGTDENMHKFNKWRLQVLERGIRMHPGRINSIVLAYDFAYGLTNELMAADDLFYSILLDNYPGMVSYKICINYPWYVIMYLSIRRLLFTDTENSELGKLVIAKRGQVFETLYKYIKPEYLPIQYGGLDGGELNNHQVFEITVKGGEKSDILITGIEAHTIVTWDVVVGGWDVEYSAQFVPDDVVASMAIVVEEPRKMKVTDLAVHRNYITEQAGKLVLSIGNKASRKSKVVAFRHLVQKSVI